MGGRPDGAETPGFVPTAVLKRDHFSEVVLGHAAGAPERLLLMRRLSGLPLATRGLARWLARREIRGLRAVQGIAGVPRLLRVDRDGILRDWTPGAPLNRARPADPAFYRDARRILREMRRRGVAHNDLAKPQNWLCTPEGRAAVIDFQLASVHPRGGRLFRALAYEDLRHLLKQKRAYARAHLTPTERRVLARRAWPSRLWMATAKPVYNFVTRRLLNWSDGEGTGNRAARQGPAVAAALRSLPGVAAVAVVDFPQPSGGVGLYAFVEAPGPLPPPPAPRADLVQVVAALPRDGGGALRVDLLELVAANRIEELAEQLTPAPALAAVMQPILDGRLNLTDRMLKR